MFHELLFPYVWFRILLGSEGLGSDKSDFQEIAESRKRQRFGRHTGKHRNEFRDIAEQHFRQMDIGPHGPDIDKLKV